MPVNAFSKLEADALSRRPGKLNHLEMEGHEADNLIVAYAQPALEKSMEAAVVSADKDLMQLIRPGG